MTLKERLLEVSGAMANSDNGRPRRGHRNIEDGHGSDAHKRTGHKKATRRAASLTEEEIGECMSWWLVGGWSFLVTLITNVSLCDLPSSASHFVLFLR